MKTFKVKQYRKEYEVYCKRNEYQYYNNTMVALCTADGLPYCTLSTNPNFHIKDKNVFYACLNNFGDILSTMVDIGIIKLGGSIWRSGWNTYQSFIINEEVFKEYEN